MRPTWITLLKSQPFPRPLPLRTFSVSLTLLYILLSRLFPSDTIKCTIMFIIYYFLLDPKLHESKDFCFVLYC